MEWFHPNTLDVFCLVCGQIQGVPVQTVAATANLEALAKLACQRQAQEPGECVASWQRGLPSG